MVGREGGSLCTETVSSLCLAAWRGGQAEQCQSASAGGKKKAERNRTCVLRSLKEQRERMRRQRLEGITATICRDC